ncbi:MAG: alpha/beta hydrolase, partial [bacterium]
AAGIKHPPTLKQKIVCIVAKTGKKIKLLFALDTTSRVILTLSARKGKDPVAYSLKPCSYLAPRDSSPRSSAQTYSKILKFLYRIFGASDYYNCKNEIMRETFKNIIAEDLTPYLSEIKKPAIIIWGEKDKYTPLADGILMNKKIKNSKLHIIKNVGHGVHIYESEKVAEIIRKE